MAVSHERNGRVTLTASTDDLQVFIKRIADVSSAWHQKVRLIRQSPQQDTANEEHDSMQQNKDDQASRVLP
jgi:hypothetical protein